ncbi:acetyl-CoA carboxylase, biotin carboxyl carrier protein [Sphingobacterium mizutaii NBRC 14946 = DSM 11724]|uniref:Biotin carboxyl carrier protein of acetyl-CoA carboxylase n=2 Tax=Sphingobacterium mizutaii TaxID=1010 RepID=A0AAJ4XA52_9SPHI|nr:acetyl-CoA carboxylase biotin carboxyl carrier protein [Sphingobacterium mizutaii]GEM69870.1 acetyl-CoA carboxylase, biotin carboxyl carrier protein [Sphingobacterium mizutaii NBRC 14946 = DSM 11724]SDL74254.1 acetyl-CoA carboxylase biotin carboxyl carrier protein [Sphingobacterium mizutaii]SNV42859.1 Biotin carboxyl carrier protein of acetyl-CoA carboxylase [Sphingobacterium mizutaii]
MSMDIKQIQDLIKFVSKSGVNEVSIEEKDFKITIKTNQEPTYVTATLPAAQVAPAVAPVAAPAPVAAAPAAQAPVADESSKYITIKSPIIGTFYRSPGPDKASFVNVGDEVTPGKVICIVEAMKLFNEIESEVSGKIVKILVNDAQPVEYDQPLFLVDPS